ncbi:condensation domain-containing protein [Streptomyces beihaiensis]|uniref:Condensation domain-containing protein n=1 Tax=Streptomyces beihaiensis TaxID=2984495 RepID=A0ABT3U2Y0_9ACTN|nr:condensation domain-containing protein [Streptomyces beihaiensis]MCX3063669.1 condensation domain-containing protein [Streptomyces beihaiensis]
MTQDQAHGTPSGADAGAGDQWTGSIPLTEKQRALLRAHRSAAPAGAPAGVPAGAPDPPHSTPFAIELRGPLDERDVRRALARFVARHPLLTARLRHSPDGPPRLDVDPARPPALEHRTAATAPDRPPAAAVRAEARRGVDPEQDGMLRAVLISHGSEHHTLLLVAHRVAVDDEPVAVLLADLCDAYESGGTRTATALTRTTTARPSPALPGADTDSGADFDSDTDSGADTDTDTDARAPGAPAAVPLTPRQRDLLRERRFPDDDGGRHVEQVHWRWQGPLDAERFATAWQSVLQCETVLRAALAPDGEPRVVLHEHAAVEVVRHGADADWDTLKEEDRRRGFDPRVPGLLRATLVDSPSGDGGRVLITFHQVLLDAWSVSVLVREFYRAYLAGGRLPGGERRPDLCDYAHWLARQSTAPAREFWRSVVPTATPANRPALPGPATGASGWGRARVGLERADADRLRAWAAARSTTESGALQAMWALLLYRASGADGPAPVAFAVPVSGRGVALADVERIPGLLTNTLPVIVHVDPRSTVPGLLAELRDRSVDMAAYEWVSLGQICRWTGRGHRHEGDGRRDELVESQLVFDNRPRLSATLRATLAAHGVRVQEPRLSGTALTEFPVTLFACTDDDGGLTLHIVHDRRRLADAEAERLGALCRRLLRELTDVTDESTAVGDIVSGLSRRDLPHMAGPAAPAPRARAAR